MSRHYHSGEALIADLQELARILERAPTTCEMNKFHYETGKGAVHSVYGAWFGGWPGALKAAGLEGPRTAYYWTDKELLALLRKLYKELGRVPVRKDLANRKGEYPCAQTYANRFRDQGGWTGALKAAGFRVCRFDCKNFTDEELCEVLRKAYKKLGHPPSANEWQKLGWGPSRKIFEERFGCSWLGVLKAAGLDDIRKYQCRYTKEGLCEILQAATKQLGHAPSQAELMELYPYPRISTYRKSFGGEYEEALKAAGVYDESYEKNRKRLSALKALIAFVERENHFPSTGELGKKTNTPCYRSCVTYFGSLEKMHQALREALEESA